MVHVMYIMSNGNWYVNSYHVESFETIAVMIQGKIKDGGMVQAYEVSGPIRNQHYINSAHIVSIREMQDWEYDNLSSDT